jgi:RNA polymerase sigma factor (sigma-70 family)
METAPANPKWELSQSAFDRFLACLDADRSRAGERYETLRQKLILYFQCRVVTAAEDAADEVLNRVMRKLDTGEEIREPTTYVFGIARLLLLEVARQQERQQELPAEIPVARPAYEEEDELASQVECLRHCLNKLTPENRELITHYYREEKRAKINARQELAKRFGVDMNSLRVRACRIRDQLQGCVKKCVQGGKKSL